MPLANSIFVRPQAWTVATPRAGLQQGLPLGRSSGFSTRPQRESSGWRSLRQKDVRLVRLQQRPLDMPDLDLDFDFRLPEEGSTRVPSSSASDVSDAGGSVRAAVTQLLMTAAAWGTVPVVTRMLFVSLTQQPSTWLCTALANLGAFLYMASQVPMEQGLGQLLRCRRSILGGCELAAWYFVGALTLLLGLQLTSATEAAFIGQLCTLIVPMVQACQGAHVGRNIWIACVLAFMGCVTLGAGGASAGAVSVQGIMLLLVSACSFAFHNIRLNAHAETCNTDLLAFWSKAAQAVLGFVALPLAVSFGQCQDPREFFSLASTTDLGLLGLWVAWNGVVVKGFTAVWQANAYKVVKPSEAEVVLATAPLFSLGLAALFLGEPFTAQTVTGAGLFVTALVLAAKKDEKKSAASELDANLRDIEASFEKHLSPAQPASPALSR